MKAYIVFGIAPLLAVALLLSLNLVQEVGFKSVQEEDAMQKAMPEVEFKDARSIQPPISNVSNAAAEVAVERDESIEIINLIMPYIIGLLSASIAFIIIKRKA